ncbi:MAG: hypothetical protein ABR600_09195 [Actinomycetota bacterium]
MRNAISRRAIAGTLGLTLGLTLVLGLLAASGPAASASTVTRAGVGVVDVTWHVGASAGQYAGSTVDACGGDCSEFFDPASHGVDPYLLHGRRAASYGIQSRLEARALVIEGPDGTRVALVKNDLYIPQDVLWRRTAQILEEDGASGIDRDHLTVMSSHDHSSPYYSSSTWGPWAFQDSFDLRFFEYYAERMAKAIEIAAQHLVPVRMGAAVSYFDKTQRNSMGPGVADDGTPSGYPWSDNDHDMMIARFDDISDPQRPKPLAILANFGQHPEFLNGNDLLTADYVGPLQRMIDRETGATLIWSQGSTGTAEPERSAFHSMHERLEFSHREYAQAERGARMMADVIEGAWFAAGTKAPPPAGVRVLPYRTGFPVAMVNRFFPGPLSHPYPSVSNCRTDRVFAGDPQAPVIGLPDCTGPGTSWPQDPGVSTDTLEGAGVPIPENYGAPSFGSLQETLGVHLQAIRLGDLLVTVCSCEQWSDQTRNVKTRTDTIQGNEWVGYDWSLQCTKNENTTWTCPDPRNTSKTLPPISDLRFRRMKAQVENDAAGWNDPAYVHWAESEPVNPDDIKGNYTHTELPPSLGYGMTMTIGMANDYNGYIATYREYQRGDHYRKALTGWGAHSSDYMATRLMQMGGNLKDPSYRIGDDSDELLALKMPPDQASADARAEAIGELARVAVPAYEAVLPDDAGTASVTRQPKDIRRFSAAFLSWIGGDNYTDDPKVRVERLRDKTWQTYADMSGEIVVSLRFPQRDDPASVASWAAGQRTWEWSADFEAFDSDVSNLGARPGVTPAGVYRFVVDGMQRKSGDVTPYHLESQPFTVDRWDGITVPDIRVEPNGTVSFAVGPTSSFDVSTADGKGTLTATVGPIDYPDTYSVPDGVDLPFLRNDRTFMRDPAAPDDPNRFEWYCFPCSFRPWADTGRVALALVTIRQAGGGVRLAPATLGADGRYHTQVVLRPGDSAFVAPHNVVDNHGETNAEPSSTVTS